MPIFMGDGHFLNDPFDVLIGCLNCTIHLRTIRSRVSMLNLKLLAQFYHHPVIQIGVVISNDTLRRSVPWNDVPFDESYHNPLCHVSV